MRRAREALDVGAKFEGLLVLLNGASGADVTRMDRMSARTCMRARPCLVRPPRVPFARRRAAHARSIALLFL